MDICKFCISFVIFCKDQLVVVERDGYYEKFPKIKIILWPIFFVVPVVYNCDRVAQTQTCIRRDRDRGQDTLRKGIAFKQKLS